jgi:hypothetical protein
MKTWDETKAEILKHIEVTLPQSLAPQMIDSLQNMESGRLLVDAMVSYVRAKDVRHQYELDALKDWP